jgi:hypothetical protein
MPIAAEPIYLLDFRNRRVVELDPASDAEIKAPEIGSETPESRRSITFAALGSPPAHED